MLNKIRLYHLNIVMGFLFGVVVTVCTVSCKRGSIKEKHSFITTSQKNEIDSLYKNALLVQENNVDSARELLLAIGNKCKALNYTQGIAEFYKSNTKSFFVIEDSLLYAENLANEYLLFAKESKDNTMISDAYESKGNIFVLKELVDSLAFYYLPRLEYIENCNDDNLKKNFYKNIVHFFYLQGNYNKAVEYTNKGIAIAEAHKDTATLAALYVNSYNSYVMLDTLKCIEVTQKSYDLLNGIKRKGLRRIVLSNKAHQFNNEKRYDSAIVLYSLVNKEAAQQNDIAQYYITKMYIAECYGKINNIDLAYNNIKIAEEAFKKTNYSIIDEKELYKVKYNIVKKMNDVTLIKQTFEKYYALSDSITKSNTNTQLLETEKKIQETEYNKSIAEKEYKISKRNNTILLLTVAFAALSIIGFLIYRNQHKKKLLQEKNIEYLINENKWATTNATLTAKLEERNRISKEIHDELGASLTSIALSTELLRTKLKDQTEEVDKISNTSTTMVDSLNEIIWSLNSGNDSLKSLIAYSRKMFTNLLEDTNINYQFIAPNLETDYTISGSARRAIYLTSKEAINNALKHSKATQLTFTYKINTEKVEVQIQDNGIGIIAKNEFGNGLINMKNNIEKIGGTFSIVENNGTTIIINYPLHNNANT